MDFGFTREQDMLRAEMERFCKKELSQEYVAWMDDNVDFVPDELWQKFADLGMFRSNVPEEYGGDSLPLVTQMVAFELICKASLSVANAVGATIGFGTRFIAELGTKEQKEAYLPLLGEGKLKMCMALTEPAGGTDILGAISTFAEEKSDRFIINGQKIFITGASRGIGREIALRCARDGARVVITGKTVEAHPKLPGTIHSVAEEVQAAGGQALAIQLVPPSYNLTTIFERPSSGNSSWMPSMSASCQTTPPMAMGA